MDTIQHAFLSTAALLEDPWVKGAFWAVVLGAATFILARIASQLLRRVLSRDDTPLPSASIIVNIVRGAIWVIGGSIILNTCFGIDTNGVIAALGVGGIAISLGFQDTLSNLIGGLQITFLKLVLPGDNIEVGATAGVVQDVTWRHTTIRDSAGLVSVIPNSVISKTALTHLAPVERMTVPFAVPRAAVGDLDELAGSLAEAAREAATGICPLAEEPSVGYTEIGELAVHGKIALQVEDACRVAAVKDAIIRAIAPLVS